MENVVNEKAITYEYVTVEVKPQTRDLVLDMYENLGYEHTSNGINTLNFKRDRRINNKKELKVLERKINNSIQTINKLESSKKEGAMIFGLTMGILGALVMGAGMALIMELNMMLLGLILGLLGIVICLPVYPIYAKLVENKTSKVVTLIEEEHDKLDGYCDEAINLLK